VFEQFEEQEAVKKSAMIEKNGYAFYSQLIEKFTDAKVLEVLKQLRDDEKKHLATIEHKYFKEAGFGDTITNEELEVELYVERKGVPDLFTRNIDMKKLIASIDNPRQALLLAMDTERHSVVFFENLAKEATSEEARDIYSALANEEKGHVEQIRVLLASLET
jgi:rubrerythrin